MDKSLQKKLVGAAVLIALAVIFLPMFLDGKKNPESDSMKIEIPPKPVYDIPNRLENQVPPPISGAAPSQPVATMEPLEAQVPVPNEEVSDEPFEPLGDVADFDEGVSDNAVASQENVASEPSVAPKSKKTPTVANVDATGFVVQVGSFGERKNAAELTDRLIASGFPAFLEDIDFRGRAIYRVKVGPKPTRGDADALRQNLADDEQLEGIVVAHP
jgi:DedD protein